MHACMVAGAGTRDFCGPSGLTTEGFIDAVDKHMRTGEIDGQDSDAASRDPARVNLDKVDMVAVHKMFSQYDSNADGTIDEEEFVRMLVKLNVAPMK